MASRLVKRGKGGKMLSFWNKITLKEKHEKDLLSTSVNCLERMFGERGCTLCRTHNLLFNKAR